MHVATTQLNCGCQFASGMSVVPGMRRGGMRPAWREAVRAELTKYRRAAEGPSFGKCLNSQVINQVNFMNHVTFVNSLSTSSRATWLS